MERTEDQRVVSLKFNNSQFESKARQTINTLANLTAKLDILGTSKAFLNIEKEAARVTLGGLTKATTNAAGGFSALEVAAIETFRRITDAALDTGAKLTKALTVDQLSSGWGKMDEVEKASRTIMAAGYTAEEVEEELKKLMWYTDETSYSFTDMVNNIGKFTAQGVPLKEATKAMMGISNWAAMSGQGISQASIAMYNLAQSLSVGAVKLMDWKSIQNANLATEEFKNQVIETAKSLGALDQEGYVIDELGNRISKVAVNSTNFASLLETGFFSKEVLLSVLQNYNRYADAVYEKTLETGYAARKAMEMVDEEAGELLDTMYGVSRAAFMMGQEATSLKDAFNYISDAVSSMWMSIYRAMLGDIEDIKNFWTDFCDYLYIAFAEPVKEILDLIEEWGKLTELDEFDNQITQREKLINAVYNILTKVTDALTILRNAWKTVFPPKTANQLADMVDRFYEWSENIQLMTHYIDEAGEDFGVLTEKGEKLEGVFVSVFSTIKRFIEFLKPIKDLAVEIVHAMSPLKDLFLYIGDSLTFYMDVIQNNGLLGAAYTFEDIAFAILDTIESIIYNLTGIDLTGTPLDEFLVGLIEKGGEIIYNIPKIFNAMVGYAKRLYDAFSPLLFGIVNNVIRYLPTIIDLIVSIYEASAPYISAILGFITNHLPEISELIQSIATVSFNLSRALIRILNAVVQAFSKVFSNGQVKTLGQMVSMIGEMLFNFLTNENVLNAIYNIAVTLFTVFKSIVNIFDKFGPTIVQLTVLLSNFISRILTIANYLLSGFEGGFSGIIDVVAGIMNGLITAVMTALGIHSPSKVFMWIGAMCIAGFMAGILENEDVRKFVQPILNMFVVLANGITKIVDTIAGSGFLDKFIDSLLKALSAIADTLPTILYFIAAIVTEMTHSGLVKVIPELIGSILLSFERIISSISKFISSLDSKSVSAGLNTMVKTIGSGFSAIGDAIGGVFAYLDANGMTIIEMFRQIAVGLLYIAAAVAILRATKTVSFFADMVWSFEKYMASLSGKAIMSMVKNFALAIALISASFAMLKASGYDLKGVIAIIATTAGLLVVVTIAMQAFVSSLAEAASKIGNAKLGSIVAIILAISYATVVIAITMAAFVKTMAKENISAGEIWATVSPLLVAIALLGTIPIAIIEFSDGIASTSGALFGAMAVILALTIAVSSFTKSISRFSDSIDKENFWKSAGMIVAIIALLFTFVELLVATAKKSFAPGQFFELVSISAVILSLSAGVTIMAKAIVKMAGTLSLFKIDPIKFAEMMLPLILLLNVLFSGIAIILGIMSKSSGITGSVGTLLAIAATISIVTASLGNIIFAVAELAALNAVVGDTELLNGIIGAIRRFLIVLFGGVAAITALSANSKDSSGATMLGIAVVVSTISNSIIKVIAALAIMAKVYDNSLLSVGELSIFMGLLAGIISIIFIGVNGIVKHGYLVGNATTKQLLAVSLIIMSIGLIISELAYSVGMIAEVGNKYSNLESVNVIILSIMASLALVIETVAMCLERITKQSTGLFAADGTKYLAVIIGLIATMIAEFGAIMSILAGMSVDATDAILYATSIAIGIGALAMGLVILAGAGAIANKAVVGLAAIEKCIIVFAGVIGGLAIVGSLVAWLISKIDGEAIKAFFTKLGEAAKISASNTGWYVLLGVSGLVLGLAFMALLPAIPLIAGVAKIASTGAAEQLETFFTSLGDASKVAASNIGWFAALVVVGRLVSLAFLALLPASAIAGFLAVNAILMAAAAASLSAAAILASKIDFGPLFGETGLINMIGQTATANFKGVLMASVLYGLLGVSGALLSAGVVAISAAALIAGLIDFSPLFGEDGLIKAIGDSALANWAGVTVAMLLYGLLGISGTLLSVGILLLAGAAAIAGLVDFSPLFGEEGLIKAVSDSALENWGGVAIAVLLYGLLGISGALLSVGVLSLAGAAVLAGLVDFSPLFGEEGILSMICKSATDHWFGILTATVLYSLLSVGATLLAVSMALLSGAVAIASLVDWSLVFGEEGALSMICKSATDHWLGILTATVLYSLLSVGASLLAISMTLLSAAVAIASLVDWNSMFGEGGVLDLISKSIKENGWQFALSAVVFPLLLIGVLALSAAIGLLSLSAKAMGSNIDVFERILIAISEFAEKAGSLALLGLALIPLSIGLLAFAIALDILSVGIKVIADAALTLATAFEKIVNTFERLRNLLHGQYDGIGQEMDEGKESIFGKILDLKKGIAEKAEGMWEGLKNGAKNIWDGLTGGIAKGWDKTKEVVGDAAEGIQNWWNNLWGIHSPSKWMEQSGEYINEGFVDGLNKSQPDVEDAFIGNAEKMNEEFRDEWGIHSHSDETTDMGKDLGGGLLDGLKEGWEKIKSWFKNLWEKIKSFLGFGGEGGGLLDKLTGGSDLLGGFSTDSLADKLDTSSLLGGFDANSMATSMSFDTSAMTSNLSFDNLDIGNIDMPEMNMEMPEMNMEMPDLSGIADGVSDIKLDTGVTADAVSSISEDTGTMSDATLSTGTQTINPIASTMLASTAAAAVNRNLEAYQAKSSADTDTLNKILGNMSNREQFVNTFNIESSDPRAVAEEVAAIIQTQAEREEAVWA